MIPSVVVLRVALVSIPLILLASLKISYRELPIGRLVLSAVAILIHDIGAMWFTTVPWMVYPLHAVLWLVIIWSLLLEDSVLPKRSGWFVPLWGAFSAGLLYVLGHWYGSDVMILRSAALLPVVLVVLYAVTVSNGVIRTEPFSRGRVIVPVVALFSLVVLTIFGYNYSIVNDGIAVLPALANGYILGLLFRVVAERHATVSSLYKDLYVAAATYGAVAPEGPHLEHVESVRRQISRTLTSSLSATYAPLAETGKTSVFWIVDPDENAGALPRSLNAKEPPWDRALTRRIPSLLLPERDPVNEKTLVVPLIVADRCVDALLFVLEDRELHLPVSFPYLVGPLASLVSASLQDAQTRTRELMQRRIDVIVEKAEEIQSVVNDAVPVSVPGITYSSSIRTARGVHSDWRTVLETSDGTVLCIVAEAVAKSVSAVFVLLMAQAMVRLMARTARQIRPAMLLNALNDVLATGTGGSQGLDQFLSIQVVTIAPDRRSMVSAVAGATPCVFVKFATSETIIPQGNSVPLGVSRSNRYREISTDLDVGDVLLMCSDGVFEAMGRDGVILGRDAIVELLRDSRHCDSETILRLILERITRHESGFVREDDQTLLVVKAGG